MATVAAAAVSGRGRDARSARILRWSARLLVACCWCSGAIFGGYIITFFGGAALRGETARWDESLPTCTIPPRRWRRWRWARISPPAACCCCSARSS